MNSVGKAFNRRDLGCSDQGAGATESIHRSGSSRPALGRESPLVPNRKRLDPANESEPRLPQHEEINGLRSPGCGPGGCSPHGMGFPPGMGLPPGMGPVGNGSGPVVIIRRPPSNAADGILGGIANAIGDAIEAAASFLGGSDQQDFDYGQPINYGHPINYGQAINYGQPIGPWTGGSGSYSYTATTYQGNEAPAWAGQVNAPAATAARLRPPASPSDAPIKLNLANLQPTFDSLWQRTSGAGVEHGCTFVSGSDGLLKTKNIVVGDETSLKPNMSIAEHETLQGTFHTHPHNSTGPAGAFSGADAAMAVNSGQHASICQSGSDQYLFLRTQRTPDRVNWHSYSNRGQDSHFMSLQMQLGGMVPATKQLSKDLADELSFAFYQGSQGVFWRVHPPVGASEIQAASAGPWKGGNVIDCMSLLIDTDASAVKQVAERLEHYNAENGLSLAQVKNVLAHFGVSSTCHKQSGGWGSLPNCALVAVLDTNGDERAVLFRRDGGAERVYEGNEQPHATSKYRLASSNYYLDIDLSNDGQAAPARSADVHGKRQPRSAPIHASSRPPAHPGDVRGKGIRPVSSGAIRKESSIIDCMTIGRDVGTVKREAILGRRQATAGTSSIGPARAEGPRKSGNFIDCIALVADADRDDIKRVAKQLGHYRSGSGIRFEHVESVLARFGVSVTLRTQARDWRSLPDFALVSVIDANEKKRAVVFRREGGTEHVYEGDEQPRETNRYRLASGEPCLEIRRDEDIADQPSPIAPPESTHFVQHGIHTFGASSVDLTGSRSKVAPVKIYTTGTCSWCDRAKELLRKRGVTHIEEVRVDLDHYEGQKTRQITGRRTVPQIFIDGEHIGGFDDLEKLDDRGGLTRRLRGSE